MVGWRHGLNGHEFKQAPGDGEGQGSMGLQRVGHDRAAEQQQQQQRLLCLKDSFGSGPLSTSEV